MIDAAYFRRQAATCRAVADDFRQPGPLLDLADYFERLADEFDAPATEDYHRRPGDAGNGGWHPFS